MSEQEIAIAKQVVGSRCRQDLKVVRTGSEDVVYEDVGYAVQPVRLRPVEADGKWWLAGFSYETETLYISKEVFLTA